MSNKPIILWFRQDLRLSDNPALDYAAKALRPIIPVSMQASDGYTIACGTLISL